MNKEVDGDKPPPSKNTIRRITSVRVYSGSNDRSIARRREMALLQHLPSPMLTSRLRNDLVILDAFR